jgi:hypothetical protein
MKEKEIEKIDVNEPHLAVDEQTIRDLVSL